MSGEKIRIIVRDGDGGETVEKCFYWVPARLMQATDVPGDFDCLGSDGDERCEGGSISSWTQ